MGLICLQGGNEFAPECREMDALLLSAAGHGPVVLLPLAGAPGREYDTAGANGTRYYRDLGAADVTVAPDARADAIAAANARAAVEQARLLVIPGGSPRRLRDAIAGTPLYDAILAAAKDDDRVVTGSSAGAMVLCATTMLPERGEVGVGLGVVADFAVIPHFSGANDRWERALHAAAPGTDILGIPECSGVLLDGENVTAVGARPSTLIADGERQTLALGG